MRITLAGPVLMALLAMGCASPRPATSSLDAHELDEQDVVAGILSELALSTPEDPIAVMNRLERLLPTWQSAQRRGQNAPIERQLVRTVVVNFDTVADMVQTGPHERRLVAAWALGFARVPPNDRGVDSPHAEALALLMPLLDDAPDDLTRNALLGIWKLGDPQTPVRPLSDLIVNHHDADVRANACLALGAVITEENLPFAIEPLLVALGDTEPRVRLHAADIARAWPSPPLITQIEGAVQEEDMPLVLAAMVRALGAAGSTRSAPLLMYLLESPREVVAASARTALIELYGEDLGPLRQDWLEYVEGL